MWLCTENNGQVKHKYLYFWRIQIGFCLIVVAGVTLVVQPEFIFKKSILFATSYSDETTRNVTITRKYYKKKLLKYLSTNWV